METAILGRTGLEVSRLGFGGAPLGLQGYLGREDKSSADYEARAVRALRTALDSGITFFDTAPGYGGGRSEEIIGKALDGRRDEFVLATKFHQWHDDGGDAERTFTESLARLRTDHVDLLQLHGGYFDNRTADEALSSGVLDWVGREVKRGRTRFVGITAETASGGLERLMATGLFDTLQIAYSLIYQSHCDHQREPRGIIPLARSMAMGVLTMRTATSGFLQRLLKLEFPELPAARVTALAIRFVLSTPEVDCALVGMKTEEEVLANVALAEDAAPLDLAELNDRYGFDLNEIHGT